MAYEDLSPLVTGIVGKLGNIVFMRQYKKRVYSRSIYKDKGPSVAQTNWRAKYLTVDMFYKSLTEEEKNSWKRITYYPGQTRYSTCMKINLKRIKRGLPLIKTPPY